MSEQLIALPERPDGARAGSAKPRRAWWTTAMVVLLALVAVTSTIGVRTLQSIDATQRRAACYQRLTMEMAFAGSPDRSSPNAQGLALGMAKTCDKNPRYGLP